MKLSVGDLFDGRFRIDGEATGLYTAQDQHTGQRVALELVGDRTAADPTMAGAFTVEARAAKEVDHVGVITVVDAGVSMSTPWIATELREGETLRARMDRGVLRPDEAIDIGIGILEALEASHRRGVVHRALSPADVVIGADGKPAIRGFGKGALTPGEAASFHVAPEQASGGKSIGPAADLHSVSAILYEALSGKLPYDVTSFGELVKAMYTKGPTPLHVHRPDVPPRLASVINHGLAVEPSQRPRDARQLIDGLRGLASTMATPGALPKTMALDSNALSAAISAPGAFSAAAGAPNIAQPAAVVPPQPQPAKSSGGGLAIGLAFGGCALLFGMIIIGGMGAGMYYMLAAEQVEPPPPEDFGGPLVSVSSLSPMAGADAERIQMPATSAPALGGDQPFVTIVTFSDFECPFCSRVDPTMDRIRETYGDRVRYVWRNNPLPFHQNAMPAAEAAHEAYEQGGDARFWSMHDLLFQNSRQLDRASIERYAMTAGMDVTRLRAALDTQRHRQRIQDDQALATRADARGTPSFFINGRKIAGAQPYEAFATIIDEEIALAQELMLRGVSRGSLYESFQRDARLAPAPTTPDPPTPPRRQPDPNAIYRVPLGNAPTRGPDTALVTVVVFSEFQCPFCARVRPTIDQISEHYGADVRIAWKNNPLPFHNNAMPAAEVAMEAHAQGRFWPMHDALFENQRQLERPTLERLAVQQGLNVSAVRRALDAHPHRAAIEADQQLARSLGASGTPSFFINGRNLRGAQPFPAFQRVIDEEMTRARALLNAGTPRRGIYEAATRNGHTTPQFIGGALDPTAAPAPAQERFTVAVPRSVPARGPANAPLTIQIFSDFQCPFCARVRPTIDSIVERYGSRVRVVWRHYPLPFHPNAMPAAQASVEVWQQGGDVAFWRYHDLLFENQRELDTENLVSFARRVPGIDASRVAAALRDSRHQARVQSDMDAVTASGMRIGTPSFLIGNRLLQGAQPLPRFQQEIDAALAGR